MSEWRTKRTPCPVCETTTPAGRMYCSRAHKDQARYIQSNPTWETALWVRGPYVALFLDRHGITPTKLGDSADRRVRNWRAGGAASFWKVDELLTPLGFHVHQLQMEFGSKVWADSYVQTEPFPKELSPAAEKQSCEGCGKTFSRTKKHKSKAHFWRTHYCSKECKERYSRSSQSLARSIAA